MTSDSSGMTSFLHRYLDPASRLGEILFGLIMALGFTGSVRLGLDEADNQALFVGILGCNFAWAIVDGVMHVLAQLFERGRRAKVVRDVRDASSDSEALERMASELDDRLGFEQSGPERERFHRWLLEVVRRSDPVQPRVHREDVLGGVAVALTILIATLPVVLPFLVVPDPALAVRVSNAVALTLLFLLGVRWGQTVGGRPWLVGVGLTAIGVVLVLLTIVLGG